MWIQKRDFEGGQKRWKKKLQGLRDRWISAGWLKCRATRTDKLRSRWCIIDWHRLRVRTDTVSPLRCSIQIDKCSIMFWKGRMCLIIGWNEGYMWPVSRAEGKGKTVTPIHKLQRSLALSTINTLITVVCDNQGAMLMTVLLWLMISLGIGPSSKQMCQNRDINSIAYLVYDCLNVSW